MSSIGGTGRFLTTVVRLVEPMTTHIGEVQAALRAVDGTHYFYPPFDLHMTILGCTQFLADPSDSTPTEIEKIGNICEEVFGRTGPFEIEGLGLNMSPTTVFVQLLTVTEALENLRSELTTALRSECNWNSAGGLVPPPYLAYSNIVRFTHADLEEMIEAVKRRRERGFGRMCVRDIELVTTDKLLSVQNTRIWRRFSLGMSCCGTSEP